MSYRSILAEPDINLQSVRTEESASNFTFSLSCYRFGKRAVDLAVSFLVVTLVLSWLIPVIAIIIRLDSRGPVFFVQKRIGYLGIPFNCYKMRTMVPNKVSDCCQAQPNDCRITAVGKILRSTNLDELPQFINVLFGDMSLVGPRPFMLKDDEHFGNVVSNYYLRHYAKSGITGIAQVKGCRGKAETDREIIHRYQWDAFYIRKAGTLLDLKIIWITALQTVSAITHAVIPHQKQMRQMRSRIGREMLMMHVKEVA